MFTERSLKEGPFRQPPESLRYSLNYFFQNGDLNKLDTWIQENGVQENPYDLTGLDARIIRMTIEGCAERMENNRNYKSVIRPWKLFYQAGLLTEDILKAELNKHFEANVSPSETVEEFKKKLQEIIKEEIGWEISI